MIFRAATALAGALRTSFLQTTAPLLVIVLLTPLNPLPFPFLDSFVGVQCKGTYLKRWWTSFTNDDSVLNLKWMVPKQFPIHLVHKRNV